MTPVLIGVLVLACVTSACSPAGERSADSGSAASPGRAASDSTVAAIVEGKKITIGELDGAIQSDLVRLEMQRYQARRRQLDQMIDQTLVEKKAAALGLDQEKLFQQEVGDKITPPTDADVSAYYEKNKDRINQPFEQIKPRIQQALLSQAMQAKQQEFVTALRKEAKLTIDLSPPRVQLSTVGGQVSGPSEAPIELVEFSDYQCPFCARSQATVDQVLKKYGDKIRHVFMDFPIERIHPLAMPASIAGRCAADQGKFRDYHKLLFENQRQLSEDNFKKWAKELSLDEAKFEACRTGGQQRAAIQKTLATGQAAGVTGTPAFFVNGVMINGAQPFEEFESLIDSELERKKS